MVDWAQTRTISKNPDLFYEKNLILGNHPSIGRVNTYFVSAIVLNYVVSDNLSKRWRTGFQTGLIGLELCVTDRNRQIGIKMDF